MADLAVAGTYAGALFNLGMELGKTDEFLEEIKAVADLTKGSDEFDLFLKSPAISQSEKKRIVNETFEDKLSEELRNFLCILIDKERTGAIQGIAKAYEALYDEENRIADGTVYSMEALKQEQIDKLSEELSGLLKKTVRLSNVIDRGLIGGMVIRVEGKIIDRSVKKQLHDMLQSIKKA